MFRWTLRILTVACAIETLASVVGGAIFMVIGYGLWRTPVREQLGTALGRSARDAHDFGVVMFLGLGAITFLYGAYELTSLVWESRTKSQI